MKVALIGDVHGNLPALEAVLTDARRRGAEAVWNIGDFVGYGAFPDEVVTRLRGENALSVIGNYDLKALAAVEAKGHMAKPRPAEKRLAFRWAHDHLSEASRSYLASLPREVRREVAGRRVLLTHGSPASVEEHLWPDTPESRLRELARRAEADAIIVGHSHQPFAREVDGVWFLNTGSVGRPDDGDPRACYAMLRLGPRSLRVRHYRIPYDVERAVAEIRRQGLPEAFAQMTIQGRSLDAITSAGTQELPRPKGQSKRRPPEGGFQLLSAPSSSTVACQNQERSRTTTRTRTRTIEEAAVLQLARECHYEEGHTNQVTRLALRLFDELAALHGLGPRERFWLECAGLLHDIGWIEGQEGHHKTALRIIRDSRILPLGRRERLIIGGIARYHRGALPKEKHEHFADLAPADRETVRALAAILRVADGLDRTHGDVVRDLSCQVTEKSVTLRCQVTGPAEEERQAALAKGDLFEQVFRRHSVIRCMS